MLRPDKKVLVAMWRRWVLLASVAESILVTQTNTNNSTSVGRLGSRLMAVDSAAEQQVLAAVKNGEPYRVNQAIYQVHRK